MSHTSSNFGVDDSKRRGPHTREDLKSSSLDAIDSVLHKIGVEPKSRYGEP